MNTIDRRDFIKKVGILAAFSYLPLNISCGRNSIKDKPNILFIFSDDHSYKAISAYGSYRNKTPNIDRLAKEGMLFDKCYVTNSICAPSRATILTGKHSHINGVFDNHTTAFDGAQDTFPKLLKKKGYQTCIIGKWHLKSTPTGFDYHEVMPGQGQYYNPDFIRNGEMLQYYGYNTDVTTNIGLEWLKNKRDKNKPFMMMLQYKAPHRQFTPNVTHAHRYKNDTIPEPSNLYDDYKGRGSAAKNQTESIEFNMGVEDVKLKLPEPQRMKFHQKSVLRSSYEEGNKEYEKANLKGKELIAWRYQRFIKDYIKCVDSIDENIGRVLEYLDEEGLSENTIIIYTSDQSIFLGEHGWFDKRFMYEESFKMPFIVKWPGVIKPGTINSSLVSNLDFAQTFLDLAGVEQPEGMQGLSLLPLMKGLKPEYWRESIYYHYYEHGAHGVPKHEGVFNGRYKLINYYTLNEWELFDLEKDPEEMNSVYSKQEYKEVVAKMKSELEVLRKKYNVPENTIPAEKVK